MFASMSDDTFSVNFIWRDARAQCPSIASCMAGNVITMSTTLQSSFVDTPPVENQAMGGQFAFTGNLTFAGPLLVLPPVTATPPFSVEFSGPFTFGGTLSTYRVLNVFEPVLISTNDLNGAGTVTGRYTATGGQTYMVNRLQYEFAPGPGSGNAVSRGSWARRRARGATTPRLIDIPGRAASLSAYSAETSRPTARINARALLRATGPAFI